MLVAILGRYSACKLGPNRGSCPESVGLLSEHDIVQAPSPLFLSRTPWIEVQAGDREFNFASINQNKWVMVAEQANPPIDNAEMLKKPERDRILRFGRGWEGVCC
jgi:hypothetical protein